ncbi:MAG: ribosomal protein S18-alanine N-acetyltransferase [Clostridiales bacterium]|nr:ribosomal protein S18-alanine N-acetyltransferase [Clostridiales bacterium]
MEGKESFCDIELVPLTLELCEEVYHIAAVSLPEHWSLQGVKDVLRYDNNIFIVARLKNSATVVGFAGIMMIVDEAELLNIAVLSEYRKKGIGQMLLNYMFQEADRHNAVRMLLEVRRSNKTARQLYERNGFTAFAERKGYYSNPKEDAIIMEKRIQV